MLVCAALDGRTVSVCYPEKSRDFGASCTSDQLCATGHCNPSTQRCDGGPGCPPCGFTATCTVEIYERTCGEPQPGRAPDETTTRTVEAKPNGNGRSCLLKAPAPSNDPRSGELDAFLACTSERQVDQWSVELSGGSRTLVHDEVVTWGSGGGGCYSNLHRYRCPVPTP